ncbi:DUF4241 domain-containing protein [Solirubrobacter sp. CPCC 204708]|uniref:DUF4241 domain-containing protein n=1 Tax=Solirubrobacter deserti TaxID=2282478 RepID=A0ABT4RK58_9ACTN|nr:DUF4241 domain-containing protein [Solirubrobacter deserti]MBE2317704.1 DUF4241 domain-containing protein [Solirubrobacter deserti]MDA0138655.1 DUF4241 domain-containing protein [Solirubrobacter deserti]
MGLLDKLRRRRPPPPEEQDEPSAAATPEQLHALFGRPDGTAIVDDGRSLTLEQLKVGELAFPTGRVAFCDPLVGDGSLFVTVPPNAAGRASALAVRLAPDHVRVAALALELDPSPVSAWRMHVPEGVTIEPGSIYGFGVDAGVACFADPTAIEALHARQAAYYDQPGPLSGPEPVVDDMYGGEQALDVLLYEAEPGLRLAISQSGWGDGLYATYLGTDAEGRLVRLMISFDLLSADHR